MTVSTRWCIRRLNCPNCTVPRWRSGSACDWISQGRGFESRSKQIFHSGFEIKFWQGWEFEFANVYLSTSKFKLHCSHWVWGISVYIWELHLVYSRSLGVVDRRSPPGVQYADCEAYALKRCSLNVVDSTARMPTNLSTLNSIHEWEICWRWDLNIGCVDQIPQRKRRMSTKWCLRMLNCPNCTLPRWRSG